MFSRKFEQVYRKIINQQTANYQITKNINIDPNQYFIDDPDRPNSGWWKISNQPKGNIKPEEWFQKEYGVKVSPNTYIIMDLFFFLFPDGASKYEIKNFIDRANTLIKEGSIFVGEYDTDGDSLEFPIAITIQQLYKHFNFFNLFLHNTANHQVKYIIKSKKFYKSIDEILQKFNKRTLEDIFKETIQLIKEDNWYEEDINEFKNNLKQFNINID